jgi:sulfate transport system ATP-binding protein
LVRPHDLELFPLQVDRSVPAEVARLQRIGFEVRAELRVGEDNPWAQLTRGQAEALELAEGSRVWVRAAD